jgi:hypothetical protein
MAVFGGGVMLERQREGIAKAKAAKVSAGWQERRASAAARPKSLGFRTNRLRC